MLLHDSAAYRCHLQVATIAKGIRVHTVLYRLSNANGEIFIIIIVIYV